jgi:putative addiction module component (TIGR02574 family)
VGYTGSMANSAIEDLIEQALRLSMEDRAELTVRLLESIDAAAPADPGHKAAWTELIDRRLQDLRDGRVEPIESSVVMARVRDAAAALARNKRRADDPSTT